MFSCLDILDYSTAKNILLYLSIPGYITHISMSIYSQTVVVLTTSCLGRSKLCMPILSTRGLYFVTK